MGCENYWHYRAPWDGSTTAINTSLPVPPTLTQTVDRFNNLFVSAFVTPGGARLLLLHDGRGDDAIRAFFTEVYELYLRVRLVLQCEVGSWLAVLNDTHPRAIMHRQL